MTTTMKRQWFHFPQNDFKEWLKKEELSKSCLTQKIGLNSLVEEYEVWPVTGGAPTYAKLVASRVTSTYYMAHIEMGGKIITL